MGPTVTPSVLLIGGKSRLANRVRALLPRARGVVRNGVEQPNDIEVAAYGSVPPSVFSGFDCVVNCVGTAQGNATTLADVNTAVAIATARAARAAGCRRFVQVSSLSVYGGATAIDHATRVAPVTDYGRSKAAADEALLALASPSFVVTCLRVPAFYGSGVRSKFVSLARAMRRLPALPVPRTLPRRSVLHLDNAAAVIAAICSDRIAADRIAFAADHLPFDLALLADAIAATSGHHIRLVPMPRLVLAAVAAAAPNVYASLYGDSLISPAAACSTAMKLPVELAVGLADMLAGAGATR